VELFRSFCSGSNAIPVEDLRGMGLCVSRLVDAIAIAVTPNQLSIFGSSKGKIKDIVSLYGGNIDKDDESTPDKKKSHNLSFHDEPRTTTAADDTVRTGEHTIATVRMHADMQFKVSNHKEKRMI